MALDYEKMTETFKKHIESPEGIAHAKAYFERLDNIDKMQDNQVDRFWNKYQDRFDEIVNKVITKYESKEYKDNWYGRGIFPPETLFFFLYDVAKKYGKEFTTEQYHAMENAMFTDQVFILNDLCFELICGQGSAIKIYKYGK